MMFKKRTNADEAKKLFLEAIKPLFGNELLPIADCDCRSIAGEVVDVVLIV